MLPSELIEEFCADQESIMDVLAAREENENLMSRSYIAGCRTVISQLRRLLEKANAAK